MGFARLLAAGTVGCLVAACGGGSDPVVLDPPSPGPAQTPAQTPAPTSTTAPTPTTPSAGPGEAAVPEVSGTVVTGLSAPWGLAFLPDRSALVSERDSGRIVRVDAGSTTEVGRVPGVSFGGEGGLLGLAVAPSFADDRFVYAYHTAASENRVVRLRLQDGRLGAPQVVLDGIPMSPTHNGGRLAFGPDGMLYVSTGDARETSLSQNPDSLGGKILRITPDGDVPTDNPDPASPVYSSGHRNVQGLTWDDDGNLWASEFGEKTWDELNLIQAGGNYGWPTVEGSGGADQGFIDPVVQWPTDQASPSGIAFADGTVFVTALRGERLWAVPVGSGRAGEPRDFFTDDLGRLRTIAEAPDGSLWLITNNTDGRGNPRADDDRIVELQVTGA